MAFSRFAVTGLFLHAIMGKVKGLRLLHRPGDGTGSKESARRAG